ncbi:MAG: TIGR01777 family oxidoreductase [Thermoproteota archaeon]|nr:TIGR01777 family oxidoreductase [Thermoproteota archaeon]
MNNFTLNSEFKLPLSTLFEWHLRDGAFERLNPPWQPLYIISKKGSIDDGGVVTVKLPIIRNRGIKWKIKHADYIKDRSFKDIQIKGFFSHWEHQHNFFEIGNKSVLEDKINYDLLMGPVGKIFSKIIDNNLDCMFKYRHRITKMDLDTHQKFKNSKINTILVSGSSGFIGSALIPFLTTGGYSVTRLLRSKVPFDYDIAKRICLNSSDTLSHLDGGKVDAVINLNGENIFGLWNKDKKQMIFDSRVKSTLSLCKNLSKLDTPPKILISASAIGIYGNDNEQIFSDMEQYEKNSNDFLSHVCSEWEEATDIAKSAGIRVVNLRTGIVLGSSGGILKKLMIINRLKTNITINHDNWLSWISLDDLLRVILFCMCNVDITGPVNAVSPNHVKYMKFMEILGKIWNTILNIKIPSKTIEILLGEMSRYAILSDVKATPGKLLLNGFNFIFDDLELALRHTLGKIR